MPVESGQVRKLMYKGLPIFITVNSKEGNEWIVTWTNEAQITAYLDKGSSGFKNTDELRTEMFTDDFPIMMTDAQVEKFSITTEDPRAKVMPPEGSITTTAAAAGRRRKTKKGKKVKKTKASRRR